MSSPEDGGHPPPETYEELMSATYRALCRHGYADLTLRKVAAESDRSRALIHYHYDSKNHLVVSLLEYLFETFSARLNDLAGAPPDDRLDALLDWVAYGPRIAGQSGQDYHTAIYELRAQAPYNEQLRTQLYSNYVSIQQMCIEIIRDGIEQELFKTVDPEEFTAIVFHAISSARNVDLMHETGNALDTVLDGLDRYLFSQLYVDSVRE
ncbi:TetR/AcrR family transcriptional regulator [Halococcus sp. IIIV-5B]|uniref:TetR/AcrR family transcriptional regulator n=1 Tax=Halococcus sp. IIIV-5B TaxID=2321230 RepID=UPI000E76D90C|nr:TetR/AcrR family transcriptional regulator [Halococcus sp. IIIV-5B]RJS99484.1 TetR/AcrR family transcriptional regulator [Halococcus sp. IIIV-5B]